MPWRTYMFRHAARWLCHLQVPCDCWRVPWGQPPPCPRHSGLSPRFFGKSRTIHQTIRSWSTIWKIETCNIKEICHNTESQHWDVTLMDVGLYAHAYHPAITLTEQVRSLPWWRASLSARSVIDLSKKGGMFIGLLFSCVTCDMRFSHLLWPKKVHCVLDHVPLYRYIFYSILVLVVVIRIHYSDSLQPIQTNDSKVIHSYNR